MLDSYAVVGPSRMSACATLTPLLTSAVGDQHLSRHFHPFGCSTTSSPVASALPALPSALRGLALATPIRVTSGSPGPCTAALSVLSCLVFRPGRRVPSVYNSSWIANMSSMTRTHPSLSSIHARYLKAQPGTIAKGLNWLAILRVGNSCINNVGSYCMLTQKNDSRSQGSGFANSVVTLS